MTKKRSSLKYTYKKFKHVERVVVRDAKGRFKKYLESKTLDRPKGEYKMIELTINFIPTKGENRIQIDDFEVLLRYPDGDYSKQELQAMADEAMRNELPDAMVDSCQIGFKTGEDFVGYGKEDKISYKIVDRTRPQYKYPKDKVWGEIE